MINWGSFLLVAVVSIGAAVGVVAIFAAGLRLLAVEPARGIIRASAYACFVIAAAVVLYGISLMVPAFHGV